MLWGDMFFRVANNSGILYKRFGLLNLRKCVDDSMDLFIGTITQKSTAST